MEVRWSPPDPTLSGENYAIVTGYGVYLSNGERVEVPAHVTGVTFDLANDHFQQGEINVFVRSESTQLPSELVEAAAVKCTPFIHKQKISSPYWMYVPL